MQTHTRNGSQYGFDAEPDEHWSKRAACRHCPDAFFADGQHGMWRPAAALHECHFHCPVRAECDAFGQAEAPRARSGVIFGGVAYDSQGKPSSAQPSPLCSLCRVERRRSERLVAARG